MRCLLLPGVMVLLIVIAGCSTPETSVPGSATDQNPPDVPPSLAGIGNESAGIQGTELPVPASPGTDGTVTTPGLEQNISGTFAPGTAVPVPTPATLLGPAGSPPVPAPATAAAPFPFIPAVSIVVPVPPSVTGTVSPPAAPSPGTPSVTASPPLPAPSPQTLTPTTMTTPPLPSTPIPTTVPTPTPT